MVATVSKNMGQPVKNRFNVPLKQWGKWSNHAKKVFNSMMLCMRPNVQWVYLHPECPPMKKDHWASIRWNVSWTAANMAMALPPITHIIQVKRGK